MYTAEDSPPVSGRAVRESSAFSLSTEIYVQKRESGLPLLLRFFYVSIRLFAGFPVGLLPKPGRKREEPFLQLGYTYEK